MTRRTDRIALALCLPLSISALVSCGESEEASTAKGPTQITAPAPVAVSPLEEIRLDPRVEFPQSQEPSTTDIAETVADFAAAFANGNRRAVESMLDPAGQAVVERLAETGQWDASTPDNELVRVVSLTESDGGFTLGLAIQNTDGAYLTGWSASGSAGNWTFTALPIESTTARSARELDGTDPSARLAP